MFEDETIDIACPNCSHKNSVILREIEGKNEWHIACEKCRVVVKVEARDFQQRLDQVRMELEDIKREANFENPRPRRVKDDYQI
jgi:transcription elongation factor Elf1